MSQFSDPSQACRDVTTEAVAVEIPDTITRGTRTVVEYKQKSIVRVYGCVRVPTSQSDQGWCSGMLLVCLCGGARGDDKISHASIVSVISVPYYRAMFAPTPFLIYLFSRLFDSTL